MNSPFHAEKFFQLSSYAHAAVFRLDVPIWETLAFIAPYAQQHVHNHSEAHISPQAYLVNPESITIGKGSIVEAGAYIQGPCIIGKHCVVRHGAYIRGNFICGDHCVIGHCSEVKNAIFLNNTHAGHFAYVGDSILGNCVNLGAGVKCANLRLDGKSMTIHHENVTYATGLRKFGAIIGDGCQLGCNSVTNPGSLLGPNVCLLACTPFGGGFAAPNSTIRWDAKISALKNSIAEQHVL